MCKIQEQPNISFVKLASLASLLAMATDIMIYSRQADGYYKLKMYFKFFFFPAAECVI